MLLREQISQPSQFSLRTLSRLRQKSPEDARLVGKVADQVLNDGIVIPSKRDQDCQIPPSDRPDLPLSVLHELMGLLTVRTDDLNVATPNRLAG